MPQDNTNKTTDQNTQTPEKDNKPEENSKVTVDQLSKIRAEERNKVHKELEAEKAERERLAEEAQAAKAELAKQAEKLAALEESISNKVDLPKPPPPADPTSKDLAERLSQMEARFAKENADLKQSLEEANKRAASAKEEAIKVFESQRFEDTKKSLMASAKLPDYLSDLVKGSTVEEVSASIKQLQDLESARETKLREELSEELRKSLPNVRNVRTSKDLATPSLSAMGPDMSGLLKELQDSLNK